MATPRRRSLRWSVLSTLFGLLYRNRALYWFASTIPFAGQWRVWQRLVLPRLSGSDVLEVGCGIGKLLADLVETGYTCAAIDSSPEMVAASRAELRRRGLALDATPIVVAAVQRLPFADNSFDAVVSTFPTDYIFDPLALVEIARVLRPGGRVIVVLGANLLPTRLTLLPLVGLQTLVYGRRQGTHQETQTVASPNVVALRNVMRHAHLSAQSELVQGPFWEATLMIGEKRAMP